MTDPVSVHLFKADDAGNTRKQVIEVRMSAAGDAEYQMKHFLSAADQAKVKKNHFVRIKTTAGNVSFLCVAATLTCHDDNVFGMEEAQIQTRQWADGADDAKYNNGELMTIETTKDSIQKMKLQTGTADTWKAFFTAGETEQQKWHKIEPVGIAVSKISRSMNQVDESLNLMITANDAQSAVTDPATTQAEATLEKMHQASTVEGAQSTSSLSMLLQVIKDDDFSHAHITCKEPGLENRKSYGAQGADPKSGRLREIIDQLASTWFRHLDDATYRHLTPVRSWIALFQVALEKCLALQRYTASNFSKVKGVNLEEKLRKVLAPLLADVVKTIHDADVYLWEMLTMVLSRQEKWSAKSPISDRVLALRDAFGSMKIGASVVLQNHKSKCVANFWGPLGRRLVQAVNNLDGEVLSIESPATLGILAWEECPSTRQKRVRDANDKPGLPPAPVAKSVQEARRMYLMAIEGVAKENISDHAPKHVKDGAWNSMDESKRRRIQSVMDQITHMKF